MFGKKKEKKEESTEEFIEHPEIQPEPQTTIVVEAKQPTKSHLVGKIISLLLTGTILGVAIYSVALRIINDSANKNNVNSYILLDGMSYNETKSTLGKFGKNMQGTICDYGFVGTKLFLSQYKITPETLLQNRFLDPNSIYTDIGLYDILNNTKKDISTDFTNGKYYLDLGKLSEGNYVIYPYYGDGIIENEADYQCFSLQDKTSVLETIYTLPDENGERKKITFHSNEISPYTIIKIHECGNTLPSNIYDFVLFYQQYNGSIKNEISEESMVKLNTIAERLNNDYHYKVKVCTTLEDAVNIKASYSFSLSDSTLEKGIASLYTVNASLPLSTSTYEEGELKGYDSLPEIREPVGYLDCGGKGYYNIVGNNTPVYQPSHVGKESFFVHDEIIDILEILHQL